MKNFGCLLLFALPFAGVGVFMFHLAFSFTAQWFGARNWVETPAKIVGLELVSETDSEGSVHYETLVAYNYTVNGATYQGNRTSISSNDDFGDFQTKIYDELEPYWLSGDPYRCFVDPDEPGRALLKREFRWGLVFFHLVFVVMFGGVGFGLIFFCLYSMKKERAKKAAPS